MKVKKISQSEINELRRIAKRHHLVGYLLTCYQTVFDHACDPNSETLAFKPEILDATNKAAALESENAKLKAACEASRQCITDFIEVYKRDCSKLVFDEAVKSLRDDALRLVNKVLVEK